MKILFLGKYPPIQGGTASNAYWLVRGLGEKGIQVSVVTNAGRVEDKYKEHIDLSRHQERAQYSPKNVHVYSLDREPPRHIPYSESFVTRLVNTGLKAIAEHGADVIYVNYLEPYAVAALMLKQLTGIPYVIRHAGSDVSRILPSQDFSYILPRTLLGADHILLSPRLRTFTNSLHIPPSRITPLPRRTVPSDFSPEGAVFDPSTLKFPAGHAPLLSYIGKTDRSKRLSGILKASATTSLGHSLLMLTGDTLSQDLKDTILREPVLRNRVRTTNFVAPWHIPSILRASSFLLHLEHSFFTPMHFPATVFEAIACGTPLIISADIARRVAGPFPRVLEYATIVQDPTKDEEVLFAVESALSNTEELRSKALQFQSEFAPRNHWDQYIEGHVNLFSSVVRKNKGINRFVPRPVYDVFFGGHSKSFFQNLGQNPGPVQ